MRSASVRRTRETLFESLFSLLLSSALCSGCVQHSEFKTASGGRGYHIICGNEFARCESKASDLCPGGFERLSSKRRSKLDTPKLFVKADVEYDLEIECDD
jgi:hypothetical protein